MLNNQSPPVSTPLEPCRIAPYVNLATIRNSSATGAIAQGSSVSLTKPTTNTNVDAVQRFSSSITSTASFSAFDPAVMTVAAHQVYAAAISSNSTNLFPQYPLNLAALAAAHSKSSSIADLRLKAKKHAESLGLITENVS